MLSGFDPSLASAVFCILCHVQLLPTAPAGSAVFGSFCQVQLLPAASDIWQIQLFPELCMVQLLPEPSDRRQVQFFPKLVSGSATCFRHPPTACWFSCFPAACVRFRCFRHLPIASRFSCFRQIGKFSCILQVSYSILSYEYMTFLLGLRCFFKITEFILL